MSSRREVFIRILALLQRKTLIETKNRTLKCLKRRYSTVPSMKKVAMLTEDGAFALFFRPHPRAFDSSRVPTPANFPSKANKMIMPGGQPGGGGGGGGAGRSWNRIDWCITSETLGTTLIGFAYIEWLLDMAADNTKPYTLQVLWNSNELDYSTNLQRWTVAFVFSF